MVNPALNQAQKLIFRKNYPPLKVFKIVLSYTKTHKTESYIVAFHIAIKDSNCKVE